MLIRISAVWCGVHGASESPVQAWFLPHFYDRIAE